jgi:hypothetical protein
MTSIELAGLALLVFIAACWWFTSMLLTLIHLLRELSKQLGDISVELSVIHETLSAVKSNVSTTGRE